MPGTIHGSADFTLGVVATDAPQWWQNRAPGVSGCSHAAQLAPERAAPQLAQKCPDAAALQRGHVEESGELMTGKLSGITLPAGMAMRR
jgi:hypothetical protein